MSFLLYNAPQSTCSQRVRFVLNAKQLPFDEKKLDLLAGDQLKPDYLALNPNGVVPTLDHDGSIVTDSSVIIEYLDEIAPEPETFTPAAPVARAKMRALMRFIDEMPAAAVAGTDLQPCFPAALRGHERGGVSGVRGEQAPAQGIHARHGAHRFSREGDERGARAHAPHLRAHGPGNCRKRRPVADGEGHHARRRRGDAGDRAHGRSRSRFHVEGHAAHRALVRHKFARTPRSSRPIISARCSPSAFRI